MSQRDSFNPIIGEAPMPLLGFGGPSAHSSGHTALVYLSDVSASDPSEAFIDRPPAFGQRIRQRYWRYEVDMAHHTTWVTLQLPAMEEAYSFTAKVCFTWTVADAAVVARFGIRDTKAIIWRYLDQLLRGISRQFHIEDSGAAEDEMNRRLHEESGDIDYGLRLSLMAVNLHLDQDAQQHLASRVGSRRATEIARDEHDLRLLREHHELEQSRLRGDLERARARHSHDLAVRAADHDRQMQAVAAEQEQKLEMLRAQHASAVEEINTRKNLDLKEQRLKFYRSALEGNSSDVLVLHLIEHPEDINALVKMLHSDTEKSYERARTVMGDLLEREMVNAADVDTLRQNVVERLGAALNIGAPKAGIKIEQDSHTKTAEKDGLKMTEKTERTTVNAA